MPTYEYACKECGQQFETVQSFHDDPLTVCSNCGGRLRKVFGNIAITFKGSGFYKTDSRSKTSASVTTPTSGGSTEAPVTPSTATPAATTEAKAVGQTKGSTSDSSDAA